MSFHSSINGFDGFTPNLYASLIYHIFKRVKNFFIFYQPNTFKSLSTLFFRENEFYCKYTSLNIGTNLYTRVSVYIKQNVNKVNIKSIHQKPKGSSIKMCCKSPSGWIFTGGSEILVFFLSTGGFCFFSCLGLS